jgi:transitional endoplasmic reticulum ATPase
VAHESEAYFASLNGPEIMGALPGESEARLRHLFEEAGKNAPSILFIDELDSIAPKRSQAGSELERRIVAQLLTLMDGLKSRRNVVVIAATNRVDAVDPALRRPGRFDREIALGIPDESGRLEILQIHSRAMPLGPDADLRGIAAEAHGYTGSDLAALVREAAMAALRRLLPSLPMDGTPLPAEALERLRVEADDFTQARRSVQPSALREIVVEVPKVRWDDIGGLGEVKRSLHERAELPLRRPDAFARLGIRAPKGVLLYGPPGTGKTMLAKAVATEARANFLTVKGSALLSKWYGESEQRISELFSRARQVTPAILFLDELDSLAPVRGASFGDSAATERVVNQLLAEMDGMEELRGVMVLGATNRPDIIDPALLRPGRFDELLFVPVPDRAGREAIFRAHTAPMRLVPDVDLVQLAEHTERYTGADIAGVCLRAGLLALRRDPDAGEIRREDFEAALRDSMPSVTEEMLNEYERIARTVRQQSARIGFR